MRSANRLITAALALSSFACGNLSNDDIAFVSAIPQSANLHVAVPALAAQQACRIGKADAFVQARATADTINGSVEQVLQLVDTIRSITPTLRETDRRTWGPWADGQHAGIEYEVLMLRTPWNAPGGYRYEYSFQGRRNGGEWLPVFEGNFQGASAAHGTGVLEIHFENSAKLQTNKPTDPVVPVDFYYDLSGDPHTVEFQLAGNGFGLAAYAYQYALYADTHATFNFTYPDKNQTRFGATSRFSAQGTGAAQLNFRTISGILGTLSECWDDLGCITYVEDQYNVLSLCTGAPPCIRGDVTACPK